MLSSMPIVKLHLYIYPHYNVLVMKTQSTVSDLAMSLHIISSICSAKFESSMFYLNFHRTFYYEQ